MKMSLEKRLLEKLAELEHRQWSHWTRHFLEFLNKQNRKNWLALSHLPYSKLTEQEKESDREWARKVLAIFQTERGLVAQKIHRSKKRQIDERWQKFKEKNTSLKRKMKDVQFYAFNVGYELAKKEDLGLLVESGTLETLKIMEDKKLMKLLRESRKKGSISSPYKPLVEDSKLEGAALSRSRVEGASDLAHQDEDSGSLNGQRAKDGSAKSPLRPPNKRGEK